jgi:hypothetical protein
VSAISAASKLRNVLGLRDQTDVGNNDNPNRWIQYTFEKWSDFNGGPGYANPKSGIIIGSNDGITWTEITSGSAGKVEDPSLINPEESASICHLPDARGHPAFAGFTDNYRHRTSASLSTARATLLFLNPAAIEILRLRSSALLLEIPPGNGRRTIPCRRPNRDKWHFRIMVVVTIGIVSSSLHFRVIQGIWHPVITLK